MVTLLSRKRGKSNIKIREGGHFKIIECKNREKANCRGHGWMAASALKGV